MIMEQTVRVKKRNPDGTAEVVHIRESACSGDCHKCSGCGAATQAVIFTAHNPINAQEGDVVVVRSESGPVLLGAAVLYMVPLVLFFVGYMIGFSVWGKGALLGCLFFVLGIGLAAVYDRLVTSKQKTEYTIVGYKHDA